jgi:hypothetical protein
LPNIDAAAAVVMPEKQVENLPHASVAVDETVAKQPAVMGGEGVGSRQGRPVPTVTGSRVNRPLQ